MSLYVYCIKSDAAVPPPALSGIQNQTIKLIQVESLQIAVSDFAGSELRPSRDNILAHSRVVESFMDISTPLPFRFGVVVREDKLREFVHNNIRALEHDLEEARDCVEMGIKVMISGPQPANATTGTDFLNAKLRLNELQRETGAWVDAAVVGLVRGSDVSLMHGSEAVIVRIAHLVPRDHLIDYKSRLDLLVCERTDCRFLRSGPWPPYSFISTTRVALQAV